MTNRSLPANNPLPDKHVDSPEALADVPAAISGNPSFGVVVLNWNDAAQTMRCVEALEATQPAPDHVLIVDNGSNDDSVNRLEEWADEHWIWRMSGGTAETTESRQRTPWLVIARAGVNRGFAGGNNIGMRYLQQRTSASHFLLLTNTATLAPDYFTQITRAILRHPRAGLLSGTIFAKDDVARVLYAGGVEHSFWEMVEYKHDVPPSDEPVPTDLATGSAMVVSRELVKAMGPLAECYFPAHWDDTEYSYRARQAGFPVLYVPKALVYNKNASTADEPAGSTLTMNRLRVFYVRRNYRGLKKGAVLGYLAITKPCRALIETIQGRPRTGWAILSGTIAGFVSPAAKR